MKIYISEKTGSIYYLDESFANNEKNKELYQVPMMKKDSVYDLKEQAVFVDLGMLPAEERKDCEMIIDKLQ